MSTDDTEGSVVQRRWWKGYVVAGVIVIAIVFFVGFYWAYLGRVDLVTAQRSACEDALADRRSDIQVRATQAWATQRVAEDPAQPMRTRAARGVEAEQDRRSVQDRLTRVDDKTVTAILASVRPEVRSVIRSLDTGRRLVCNDEHPSASLLR